MDEDHMYKEEGTKRGYDESAGDDEYNADRHDDRGDGRDSRRDSRGHRGSRTTRSPPNKRRQVADPNDIFLKILVPSYVAGAVLGKRGAQIEKVQKETGAKIVMSKPRDFFPGTTERVCLISGNAKDIIMNAHQFVMDTMRDKPEQNPERHADSNEKVNMERHKQVKILVPNSTVGMIIGQGGKTIRQIKDDSGAYVQISQKSRDNDLVERCVTVQGHIDQNRSAVDMILDKIIDDPESGSCPNLSYADYDGPVPSVNPTGQGLGAGPQQNYNNPGNFNNSNFNNSSNFQGGGGGGAMANQGMAQANTGPVLVEQLRLMLRTTGYSDRAVEEISTAIFTLANYGLLGLVGIDQGLSGLGGLLAGRVGQGSSLANISNMLQRSMTQGAGAGRSDPYDRYADDRSSRNNRNDYQNNDYRSRSKTGDRNEGRGGGGRRY